MYNIEMHEASREFERCWNAAGAHLNSQVQDGLQSWLRAHLAPPFLEHLSFRLGNQLFFISLNDVDGRLEVPGGLHGLLAIADGCQGSAYLMPMKKEPVTGGWVATLPGWGLIDARTKKLIDPVSLLTDEKIPMTNWELHDLAVQVVRDQLINEGYKLMSWQGNPNVDPAIWFLGESKGPEYVVVRAARYPLKHAARPTNWDSIAAGCAHMSTIGHYAQVVCASTDDPFDPTGANAVPLWRGHGVHIKYEGLEGHG